jgi:hypothetical protein
MAISTDLMTNPYIVDVVPFERTFGAALPGRDTLAEIHPPANRGFPRNWVPKFLFTGLEEVNLLEMRRPDGREVTWFLNPDLVYLTDDPSALDEAIIRTAQSHVDRIWHELWEEVVCGRVGTAHSMAAAFATVNHESFRALLQRTGAPAYDARDRPVHLLSETSEDGQEISPRAAHGSTVLDVATMIQSLKPPVIELAIAAARKGRFTFPSPVDGKDLECEAAFILGSVTFAYRFRDPRYDLTFFVIATQPFQRFLAFYFPDTGETYIADREARDFLREHQPGLPLSGTFIRHLTDYGTEAYVYSQSASKTLGFIFGHHHLGHHLWQDLTGICMLSDQLRPNQIPETSIVGSKATEMFGRVDDLFPAFGGKINRDYPNHDLAIRHAYRNATLMMSPTGFFVPRRLGDRIKEYWTGSSECTKEAKKLRMYQHLHVPIILIGLRVENRTIVDFTKFCIDLVVLIRRNTLGAVVILDGHSAIATEQGEFVYTSHMEDSAIEPPIVVERRIGQAVKDYLQARPHGRPILLEETTGLPMSTSVFWSCHCDFFIAPWGAGLAKYRWIANKPGLILASHRDVLARHDLDIYQNPGIMENPYPVRLLDGDAVEDVPEFESTIPRQDDSRMNFRANLDAVERELIALLTECAPWSPGRTRSSP